MIANKTDRFSFHYTDTELKKLLSTLVVLVDTREQVNEHILTFLDEKKVAYDRVKLDTGDYSCKVPKNEQLGVIRDLYLPACLERKNSIDELAQSIKEERFEFELIRGQRMGHFLLVVEDTYENLIAGNYRSQYNPQALLGRLKSFESRFSFNTIFIDKKLSGHYILYDLYYHARNMLKAM